jgi:predicted cation transporter
MVSSFVIIALTVILLLVLFLPFLFHIVEENLEIFLFFMGLLSLVVTNSLHMDIIKEGLHEPVKISLAVFIAGLVFKYTHRYIKDLVMLSLRRMPFGLFIFLVVVTLGLLSSVITAIIASLVLVEIINVLKMDRRRELFYVVVACLSIGVGAALTPIGEPLATIAISKLKTWPQVDFFYLLRLLGPFIIPIVLLSGLAAGIYRGHKAEDTLSEPEEEERKVESIKEILLRTFKVYLFVMALVFLGYGFKPIIDNYVLKLSPLALYWVNMISAIVDNATLTAAEISTSMTEAQVRDLMLGLLLSGVMLIPGNIPNIICASKLRIKSREWAKIGIPIGLVLLVVVFVLLLFV